MNIERLILLYRKFKDQSITTSEWRELQAELKNPESYDILGVELDGRWSDFTDQDLTMLDPERFDIAYEQILNHSEKFSKPVRLWPKVVAAAAAVAFIVIGVYFINYQKHKSSLEMLSRHDIAPGRVGATLTLASGKKVRLTAAAEGEIANEAGVVISKAPNGELIYEIKSADSSSAINTLSTANRETYQLKLPDGSTVWLNSGSSLTYSAGLMKSGKRMVALHGEAYFQVAKDKVHPFIVQTSKQDIEVLGTQFNVSSYRDEAVVATTLIEGSVKVRSGESYRLIKPGEQAVTTAADIVVKKADIDQITDWKKGDFNLNELNFRQAMREISRWYDVEVVYDEDVNTDFQTVGWISRNKKLSVVLQSIQSLGRVHFRVEGRKIYVVK
ncbi:FecR family protein [Pedobacter psychroterrae]|uniref:FecR family protein n=1 Tax=Pedobacter psychroterrae TaxID=2530453 RepID=A0A4R0ND47_9SPHI|nr:FecR family protein [Pedobacter psychroterrae]TCC98280.1 FecR family protein [Pedobacter psychroterrae]